MVTTSKLHALLNALVDALQARAGLAGVQVVSGPLGKDSARESIQFFDATEDQEWGALGRRSREESFLLRGAVWVNQPGDGEEVIRTVRGRAAALLAEVETQLRDDPSVGNIVRVSAAARYELEQGANEIGRWTQITFWIGTNQKLPTA